MPRFPAAFPLPALAFWSSCSRRGIGRSLRSPYQCARRRTGPRRGFRVSHARAAIGVGALSTPGTTVLALTGVAHRPAPAASQRRVPALRQDIASMRGSALRSITKGSRVFTRPIFPLPVAPGCNGSVLGFTPSFAPRPCGRRTSRWGQVIEHGPETTLYVIDLASNPSVVLSMRATSRRTRLCRSEEVSSRSLFGAWIHAVASAPPPLCSSSIKASVHTHREQAELHSAAARRSSIRALRWADTDCEMLALS